MNCSAEPIENYISELDHGLCGGRHARRTVLVEIRDGLLTAAEQHVLAGLAPPAAAAAAAREFGAPSELAAALRPELAARTSRRVSVALLATGPIVGGLWATTAFASIIGRRLAHSPGPWTAGRLALALSIAAAIGAAALCLAATGRASRALRIPITVAPAAAGAALALAAAVDSAVLGALLVGAIAAPTMIAWTPALAAAVASSSRLALTTRGARRCLHLHQLVLLNRSEADTGSRDTRSATTRHSWR
jgi:hypothetical protein